MVVSSKGDIHVDEVFDEIWCLNLYFIWNFKYYVRSMFASIVSSIMALFPFNFFHLLLGFYYLVNVDLIMHMGVFCVDIDLILHFALCDGSGTQTPVRQMASPVLCALSLSLSSGS